MRKVPTVTGTLLAAALPIVALALALGARQGEEPENEGWPRRIETNRGDVVVYQPQLEEFEGDRLSSRSAVSVTAAETEEPLFGAVWYEARVATDRDERTVEIVDLSVPRVRFPNLSPEQQDTLARFLEQEIPKWELTLSLDRLLTSLALVEERRATSENLNNDPPAILVVNEPAVLVTIEGPPRMQAVENSELMRVLNTPFTILYSPDSRTYYLFAGEDSWYVADAIDGEWQLTDAVPREVVALTPQEPEETEPEAQDSVAAEPGPPPTIVVATEPTELIVLEGDPQYTPVDATDLLYVANTESDVLLEIDTQRYFLLLSGRWYAGESLFSGPWSYVAGEDLPEDFANIPPESDVGHLLVWVPGTELAEEALLDNQIPQTSAIKRSEAQLEVTYDGAPEFEPIEDTEMEYAVNTASQVIKVGEKYYACDQAVWFVADRPSGPWVVADSVPPEIYTIPPTNPTYNVTYVYVYESTPEVVYVGYYPGYSGSYVYGGTIVYGTGWYYPSWYGAYYYPRPATWGFHMRWNPWYGWSFGFSYSTGPFTFHIGFGGWRGWWGPAGYRGYRHGYHRGWHHGYRAGARAGYRAGQRDAYRRNNIYDKAGNRARNAPRAETRDRQRPNVDRQRDNNVYTDRDGNVHRRNQDGSWQQRDRDGWGERRESAPSQGGGRAEGRQPSTRDRSSSGMNRDYQARQRGSQRTQNYSSQRSRPSGGRTGGRRGRR
jgi:hypothetical protein